MGGRSPVYPPSRGGFALAVVVFLLFAVGMAAAAGYAVVSLEADMAGQAGEAARSLSVARAGLERFLGEHLGEPADSAVYAMADGTAVVKSRRLATVDAARGIDLYLLESEGRVVNPVNPRSPARRLVTRYAHLHTRPVGRRAAAVLSYADVRVTDWGQIRGNDHSGTGSCAESRTEGVPGMAHRGSARFTPRWDSLSIPVRAPGPPWRMTGTLVGVGPPAVAYASHGDLYDAVGIRWDVLTDPAFPVAWDGAPPPWGSLPPGEYPLVRYRGNLSAGPSWSGRGVLLVTGNLRPGSGFAWDGIVLAGGLDNTSENFWIRGMLVAGLNGGGTSLTLDGFPEILYDVCSVLAASRALAYFEPVGGTWWEAR